jgi:hypothetical protein
MLDTEIIKRMGENVLRMADEVNTRAYSIGAGSDGRYSIGETGVNRLAGAEIAGIVHKGEAGGSG